MMNIDTERRSARCALALAGWAVPCTVGASAQSGDPIKVGVGLALTGGGRAGRQDAARRNRDLA